MKTTGCHKSNLFHVSLLLTMCVAAVSIGLGQTTSTPATTAATAPVSAAAINAPSPRPLIDYFLPMPILSPLTKEAWGAEGVLPRDVKNGLEDVTNKNWSYWDGQILKDKNGKFHLFASRWAESAGHRGWGASLAIHAVSDNLFGPYLDRGPIWPDDQGGKGHNVTALQLPGDEGYAIVISETRPGAVWTSKSLDGPWTHKGLLKVNGQPNWRASNVQIMVRPNGDFQLIQRNGQIGISKAADGILGPYTLQGPSCYPRGIPNLEDPHIFIAGGLYHITVNSWSTRKAYHLTSEDGISNWKNRGSAYDPTTDFLRYTDGTKNHWNLIERPAPYIEDGVIKAFSFAVLDVPKDQELGKDNHGNKIIVVPFDGEKFNDDMKKLVAGESAARPAVPAGAE